PCQFRSERACHRVTLSPSHLVILFRWDLANSVRSGAIIDPNSFVRIRDCSAGNPLMGMMVGRRRSPGRDFPGPQRGNRIGWTAPLRFCLAAWATSARAADLNQAEALYRAGKYDECARLAEQEIAGRGWGERWRSLKIAAELARGKYAEA